MSGQWRRAVDSRLAEDTCWCAVNGGIIFTPHHLSSAPCAGVKIGRENRDESEISRAACAAWRVNSSTKMAACARRLFLHVQCV